jgi:hypothetical protein
MYCRPRTAVKTEPYKRTVYCLKCRSWHCEDCAPVRKEDLKGLARRGEPTTFLTLTISTKQGSSPEERARLLARAWRVLRQRMKKKFKLTRIAYLTVFEKTKRGEPHLHILGRWRYIPQKWISDQMADLIGSPIVDIRRVKDKRAIASYVSKYIAKDPTKFEGCKRYYRSQDYEKKQHKYVKPPLGPDAHWSFPDQRPEVYIDWMISEGWSPEITPRGTILTKPPPTQKEKTRFGGFS